MRRKPKLHNYYVGSPWGWFVVAAPNARAARRCATEENGRGRTDEVRRATDEEARSYLAQKSLTDIPEYTG